MRGDGLLLRGVKWRLGVSVLTVLTATIAVATAVLGPLYLHAADDSVLRQTIASAAVQDRGVTLVTASDQPRALAAIQRAERVLLSATGAQGWFGAPLTTVMSGVKLSTGKSQLFSRTGICQIVHFQQGSCPLGLGDVAMTARSARQAHVTVGGTIAALVTGRTQPLRLRVSGIVSAPDLQLPYWWGDGSGDFPFGKSLGGPLGPPETDPLIASPATALAVPAADVPTVIGQVPLRPDVVGVGDESTVRRLLARTAATLRSQGIRAGTRLPALFAQADHERRQMTTIVAVAAIQLVLLAVWVLGSLLVRSSDARRSEARVARLRGFPAVSMAWVTAAEPGSLCLLGSVLGVIVAWVAVVIARSQLFVPSTTITFDGWTIAALGLTLMAIAAALAIGVARLLRSSDLANDSVRTSTSAIASRIADAVLIVLALVALVALGTNGALNGRQNDPLASAAPGLIALGAAVLAVGLVLFVCRLGISLTANSRHRGLFLALRQTARRPAVLRQARVLIIALSLACFAAATWAEARTNRITVARFQVGARTVVTVAARNATGLEKAVHRVDPSGRFAMAVIDVHTPSTTLLAVDARRLAAAATWPRGVTAQSIRDVIGRLTPETAAAVQLPDAPLRVQVWTTSTVGARVRLGAWVSNGSKGSTIVDLGALHEGRWTYHAELADFCPGGCRLAGLGVLPAPGRRPPKTGTVRLTVTHLWSQSPDARPTAVSADLVASDWRATAAGVSIAPQPTSGLRLVVTADAIANDAGAAGTTTAPMASPADHPRLLPAVVTSEQAALNGDSGAPVPAQGLDGNTIDVRPIGRASALPRVGADAAMVDLALLSRVQTAPTSPDTTDEVWLGRDAPSDALARFRAAGLKPTVVQRSSTEFAALQRSAPALADDFLLVATVAALLAAAASTLGALGATTRQRATELMSLEVAGVPRRALVRSLGIETGILLLTALSGAVVGTVAAAIASPSLPELSATTFAPVHHDLPVAVIAVVVVIVLAAVALADAVITFVLLRRMSPTLLRTLPDDAAP
jgi:putative ABC transport system permease protein